MFRRHARFAEATRDANTRMGGSKSLCRGSEIYAPRARPCCCRTAQRRRGAKQFFFFALDHLHISYGTSSFGPFSGQYFRNRHLGRHPNDITILGALAGTERAITLAAFRGKRRRAGSLIISLSALPSRSALPRSAVIWDRGASAPVRARALKRQRRAGGTPAVQGARVAKQTGKRGPSNCRVPPES